MTTGTMAPVAVPPETNPVVLVNPASGTGTAIADLERDLPGCRIEECLARQLAERVGELRAGGVPFVGIAGGDGTLRAAAEVLAGGEVALLPVPAGTRNHFARDLGIASTADAGAAARDGVTREVDVGSVNGRCFLNNASLGAYPNLVEEREERERRWPKPVANVIAAWRQLRRGGRLQVIVDGEPFAVWSVFVGNGRYGDSLRDLVTRDTLDANVLDIRIVRADQRLARSRLFASVLFGRLGRDTGRHSPRVPVAHDRAPSARGGSDRARRRGRERDRTARVRIAARALRVRVPRLLRMA